ncbi:hypothetical protein C4K38_6146 [Pseudomonas chlororaphis subsp. piscium]|nr:hypothetical protein C4K38_6146 [Pseudomonas chlororaphis subsp. piscium]
MEQTATTNRLKLGGVRHGHGERVPKSQLLVIAHRGRLRRLDAENYPDRM